MNAPMNVPIKPSVDAATFDVDSPSRDLAALKRAIANKLLFTVGKDPEAAQPIDWLHAAA